MRLAAEKFCNRLGVEFLDEIIPFYEEGLKLYKTNGKAIVDTDRLCKLNNKYNFFRKWFPDVLSAAELVAEDEDLLLFTYVLYAMIRADSELVKMEMPDRGRMDTDFVPMFSLLFCLEDMIEKMEARELPFDVISNTLQGFDAEINDYFDMFGRSGMRIYVDWFMLFVRCDLIRVGRLNFEMTDFKHKVRVYQKGDDIKILIDGQYMHKKGMVFGSIGQTDEEGKFYADITEDGDFVSGYSVNEYGECVPEKVMLSGYREVLRYGDKIVNVHIPAHEPFSVELCREAYEKASGIFKKHYKDYPFKAYCCFSWMLEKRLRDIMQRDTNITKFADDYTVFPLLNDGSEVYTFLFHLQKKMEPQQLPENSSMQRAVKKYLCDGNYFYQKGGVIIK